MNKDKDSQWWHMKELQSYLLEAGVVNDPNWLNNYLRPEFKKAMEHLVRMSQAPFLKKSSIYEILGVDFMLDDNMNLWFIEANIFPALEGGGIQKKTDFMMKMLKDHFEVVTGLLRSRLKRIIYYVSRLVKEGKAWSVEGNLNLDDVDKRREEFNEVTKNRFEKEFEPGASNRFKKIIDESYEDAERMYSGLIRKECL